MQCFALTSAADFAVLNVCTRAVVVVPAKLPATLWGRSATVTHLVVPALGIEIDLLEEEGKSPYVVVAARAFVLRVLPLVPAAVNRHACRKGEVRLMNAVVLT